MQISYHFAQTKIQKLQNLKNNNNKKLKKKTFFLYQLVHPVLAGMYRTGMYINIKTPTFYTGLNTGRTGQFWAISAGTGCTSWYRKKSFFFYFLLLLFFKFCNF